MSKQLFYYYCNSTEIPFYRKKYENVLSRNLFDNRTIYTTKIFNQTGKKNSSVHLYYYYWLFNDNKSLGVWYLIWLKIYSSQIFTTKKPQPDDVQREVISLCALMLITFDDIKVINFNCLFPLSDYFGKNTRNCISRNFILLKNLTMRSYFCLKSETTNKHTQNSLFLMLDKWAFIS